MANQTLPRQCMFTAHKIQSTDVAKFVSFVHSQFHQKKTSETSVWPWEFCFPKKSIRCLLRKKDFPKEQKYQKRPREKCMAGNQSYVVGTLSLGQYIQRLVCLKYAKMYYLSFNSDVSCHDRFVIYK